MQVPAYRCSRAFYRTLLLALPRRVRAELGADMEAVFAICLDRQRRTRGRHGAAIALVRGVLDAAMFAAVAHRDERRHHVLETLRTGRPPERPMKRLRTFAADLLQDIQFALRLLIKDRNFTATALLTLAICIGANAAIFSIVRSVVLKPLPVPGAERIVIFHNNYPNAGANRGSTGVPDYFDRKAQMDATSELALYRRQGATLGGKDGARRLVTLRATPSFFRLVSLRPQRGRIFRDDEGELGKENVVVLSHAIWQREFDGSQDPVGRELKLSGTTYQVVGVAPPEFKFLWNDIDVYMPAAFSAVEKSDESRHSNNWQMIGLLKPDRTVATAQEQVNAINQRNEPRFPQFTKVLHDAGFHTAVAQLQSEIIGDVRPVLMLLWGGVVFVLLIGCLNIANLVLVRASGRAREMATRHAIGADLRRLSRQLLTETTLLSLAGGAIGLLLGWWALRLVPALGLDEMPRGHEIGLDPTVAAIILSMAVAIGLLIGLVPVARLWRLNLNSTLREEGRGGTAGRTTNRLRQALATAQVTIAFVLLIGAGLLLVSFRNVLRIDPGFTATGVVTGAVSLPGTTYADGAREPFVARLLAAVRALPGVENAGVTSTVPMSGDHNDSVILAEGYQMKEGESLVSPSQIAASDGYFETMKIGLVRGRFFNASDTSAATRAIIVDERMVAHFWPGEDPIGRRMYLPGSAQNLFKTGPDTKWLTVVGVVKQVQYDGLATGQPAVGTYYFPYGQSPVNTMGLIVRTSRPGDVIVPELQKAIAILDPILPLYAVHTMDEYVSDALISRRVPMLLAVAFAAVSLFLSAIGIYGVLAYGVAQRRREIGIRLALGSTSREVFGLVLRDGVKIVATGLVLGLGGLIAVRQALTAVLFGVTPMDPVVIASVAAALSAVALLAMFIPARRAASVNPASILID
ncbi:MAG: ABC transporter permease [Vicinamibacterales bacterium]